MKKKVTSLLLALMLALSLLPPTALAATGGDTLEAAALQLRAAMVQRQDPVTVEFTVPDGVEDPRQFTHEIYDLALTHTGVPTEGDYLAYQNGGWNAQISYYGDSEGKHYSVTYYMQYYTTVQQEAAVMAAIEQLLPTLNGRSSYEKVRTIYDFITKNVSYDYDNLNDDSYKLKCTCHNALVQHSAVCQGYALLFYRLALECGLDARIITGTGNGEPHAWNLVKLDGKYYNLDSTWDAGRGTYSYFLRCDANFSNHIRDDAFATAAFHTAYPMGDTDYAVSSDEHEHIMTYTADVAPDCTTAGNSAYYTCADCGKYFADSAGEQEIAEGSWVLNATGHHYIDKVTAPTCTAKGYTNHTCSVCGDSYRDSYIAMKTLAQAKITSIANTSTGITVKWGKVTGATAYQVYRRVGSGEWKLWKTTTSTSVSNSSLTNGTRYQYKVRAVVKNSAGTVINKGEFSAIKTMYRLTRPTLASGTKNIATRKIVVKWNKNTKVTGYQVKYVKGTTTRTVTVKGASSLTKTLSSLTKGATYKVYVRSYKSVSGTNYYSAWSAYKSVKVNR